MIWVFEGRLVAGQGEWEFLGRFDNEYEANVCASSWLEAHPGAEYRVEPEGTEEE